MNIANKSINHIVLIALVIVPLIYLPFGEFNDYFYAPKLVALTLLAGLYVISVYKNRSQINQLIDFDRINQVLLLYYMILLISLFFATNIRLAIQGNLYRQEGFSTLIVYGLLFIAARKQVILNDKKVKMILMSACIVSLYGLLQYYSLEFFPRDFMRVGWVAAFSTIGNPNFLGSYLVLMLPLTYYLFVIKKSKSALLSFVLLFWCLLATNTRGAWIGALVSFTFLFCYGGIRIKNNKKIFLRITILAAISLIIIFAFNMASNNLFSERVVSISKDIETAIEGKENAKYAGSNRFYIWSKVLILIQNKPMFGYGIENLQIPFVKYFGEDSLKTFGYVLPVDKAHNEFLHIAVSSGVPSLCMYLFFVFLIILKYIKSRMKSQLSTFLFLSIIGYLSQAFFNISVVSVAFIYWIFLGLLTNECDHINTTEMEN